jgi:hypothetical protein
MAPSGRGDASPVGIAGGPLDEKTLAVPGERTTDMSGDTPTHRSQLPLIVKVAAQNALARTYDALQSARDVLEQIPEERRGEAEYRRLEAELDQLVLEHGEAVSRVAECPLTLADLTRILDEARPRRR